MRLVALVLAVWAASATPQVLDLSLRGLEATPKDLCARRPRAANLCGNKLRTAPPCCNSFRRLYLYRNSIKDLPDDWLAECTDLEELSVSQNLLRQLPERLLSSASRLRRLQASRNHVKKLPPSLLRNATSLQELDLSHNELVELPNAFLNETSRLVELFLQANGLRTLPEGILANCGSLKVLWLSHNRLERLPKLLLAATPLLRRVQLDHNLIEDVPRGTFDNNPQLRFLDLSSNRLASLPTDLFRKATSLQVLRLSDNLLTVVPPLPQQPAVIDLSHNFLQTVEDFGVFGTSRVTLDYNAWCQDLIPASQLSKFTGLERRRWFEQRPVRYDRISRRATYNETGLLKCGASAAAPKDRVTNAADASTDLNITHTAPTASMRHGTVTESLPTSERIVPSTTDIGSKDLTMGTGRVTFDSKHTIPASTIPKSSTAVSYNVEAISYETTIDANGSTETPATGVSSDIVRTTQPESNTSGYSQLVASNTPNNHGYESNEDTSPESTSTTETPATNVSYEVFGTTQTETSAQGYSELKASIAPNEHNDGEINENTSPESNSTSEASTEETHQL